MKIIAIEEHWNSAAIRDALDRLPNGARDESIAFNTMGDNQGAPPSWVTSAPWSTGGPAPARWTTPPTTTCSPPRPALFWMDRADSLSGIARHLERRVSDYITTNIHITSSGMLQERLLRHALDFTGAGQVLFSTDYPFHQPGAAAVGQFFDAIPDPADRSKIASGNAEALFHLTW